MKSLIVGLLFIASTAAFADTKDTQLPCISQDQISADASFVEIRLLGSFAAISIPTAQAKQFVSHSEKIARGEKNPFCEKITDNQVGVITEYSACYSADTVDLQFFGSFAAVSICTSSLEAALPSR